MSDKMKRAATNEEYRPATNEEYRRILRDLIPSKREIELVVRARERNLILERIAKAMERIADVEEKKAGFASHSKD